MPWSVCRNLGLGLAVTSFADDGSLVLLVDFRTGMSPGPSFDGGLEPWSVNLRWKGGSWFVSTEESSPSGEGWGEPVSGPEDAFSSVGVSPSPAAWEWLLKLGISDPAGALLALEVMES